jgi:cyclin-dependent kinase
MSFILLILGLLRLLDIVHADQKLYLVFEFLDVDLKRYMETGNQNRTPITKEIVKVSAFSFRAPPLPLSHAV